MSSSAAWEIVTRHQPTAEDAKQGVHYTPPDVARLLYDEVTEDTPPSIRVLDPMCGTGVFLLAALDAKVEAGITPFLALKSVFGSDVDVQAVQVAKHAVKQWAVDHGISDWYRDNLSVADGFVSIAEHGPGMDLIIGNPPFRGQLKSVTAFKVGNVKAGAYCDLAALFLIHAYRSVRKDGRVAFIQPRSLLASRDARQVREEIGDDMETIWMPAKRVFSTAMVDVCAPIIQKGSAHYSVKVIFDDRIEVVHQLRNGNWSPLAAVANEVPEPPIMSCATVRLEDVATVVAAFRDEYYGMAECTHEGTPTLGRQLVTCGAIDIGQNRWGISEQRFAKKKFMKPRVDMNTVSEDMYGWLAKTNVPKILVASQTSVIEAVEDHDGNMVGSTPVLQVIPNPGVSLTWLAAAMSCPTVAAHFWWDNGGHGMSPRALAVTAQSLRNMVLPLSDSLVPAWESQNWHEYCEQDALLFHRDDSVSQWWLTASKSARN